MLPVTIQRSLLILGAATTLVGCGSSRWTARSENPVIKDYLNSAWGDKEREIGILATSAAHRVIVMRLDDGQPNNDTVWQQGEFCAEPPPDASVSVASLLGGELALDKGVGSASTDSRTAEASFYRQIATAMLPLVRRSQGLQWNRDQMSYLCHAYLNRRINRTQHLELMKAVIDKSADLIKDEMQTLPRFDVSISGATGNPQLQPQPATSKTAGQNATDDTKTTDGKKTTDK